MARRVGLAAGMLFFAHLASAQLQFTQQGSKLVGEDSAGPGQQGTSVAISADGNTAIVGGPSDDCTGQGCVGAAWIYTRSNGVWSQQGPKLFGTGAVGGAYQGSSVAISGDGNTAAIGGYGDNSSVGAVWIFTRSDGVWSQQGNKLVGTGAVGAARQGSSVAISGDGNTVILGGPYDNDTIANFSNTSHLGAAWIFTRTGTTWSQQGIKLVGHDNGSPDFEGTSVALSADGNTALVGGPFDSFTPGAAWVYVRSGGVWSQQGKLTDSGAVGGDALFLGSSVAISGDGNTAILGQPYFGYQTTGGGAALPYSRSGDAWSQQGNQLAGSGAERALQGWSVATDSNGNTAIVGGPSDNFGNGAIWVYLRSGGVWTQQGTKLTVTGSSGAAWPGYSVASSADGKTAIIGGPRDDSDTGAAWIFVAGQGSSSVVTPSELSMIGDFAEPSISRQPQSQNIQTGLAATLAVTASGREPIFYQWYEGVSGDTSSPVGTDSSRFTTPELSTTTSYWVRVIDSCGFTDSEPATVVAEKAAVRSAAQTKLAPPPQQFVLDFGAQSPSGPSASLVLSPNSALDSGNTFTIEFWLYLEGASPNTVLLGHWLPQSADFLYAFYTDASGTAVGLWQNSGTGGRGGTSVATIPLHTWTHIAGTLNGQTLSLIVNGVVESAVHSPGPPSTVDGTFYQVAGSNVLAALRQVRIWSRALTPAEITSNASRYVDPSSPGLLAYWPMDDGPGSTVQDLGPSHSDIQMPPDYMTDVNYPRWIHAGILETGPYFSFEPYQTSAPNVGMADLMDFNSDGFPDILAFQGPEAPMFAFANDGHGHFSDATARVFGGPAPVIMDHALAVKLPVADFDGDGLMDCFITGTGEGAHGGDGVQSHILMQKPGGHLVDETATRIPIQNTFTHSVAIGDFDGNGSTDIFMGNLCCAAAGPMFLMNDGTGHFTPDSTRIPAEVASRFVGLEAGPVLDVNKDGHLDLVVGLGQLNSHDGILSNDGTAHFSFLPAAALPLRCGGPDWGSVRTATADLDGDGWPDLVVIGTPQGDLNYTHPCIQLFLNNGNGTFRDATDRIPSQEPNLPGDFHEVEAVDLDGNGWVDFIVHAERGLDSRIYLNKGGGFFVEATDLLPMKGAFSSIHAGDIDNDGKQDLLVTGGTESFFVLRQLKPIPLNLFKSPMTPVPLPPVASIHGRTH